VIALLFIVGQQRVLAGDGGLCVFSDNGNGWNPNYGISTYADCVAFQAQYPVQSTIRRVYWTHPVLGNTDPHDAVALDLAAPWHYDEGGEPGWSGDGAGDSGDPGGDTEPGGECVNVSTAELVQISNEAVSSAYVLALFVSVVLMYAVGFVAGKQR
jgi:hypothetical protein